MKHIAILIIVAIILILLVLATDQSVRWRIASASVTPNGCGEKTCRFEYTLRRDNETKTLRVDARTYLTYGIGMWCEVPRLAIEPVSLNCYISEK